MMNSADIKENNDHQFDERLINVTDIFGLVQECGGNLEKFKTTYATLLSRTRQQSFLSFLTDKEIIESGIFNDLDSLVKAFPNLRY